MGIDFDCIPEGCRDQHLPMAPEYAKVFEEKGIRGMGIHEMTPPYEIRRKPVGWHLALITLEGEALWYTEKDNGVMSSGDIWVIPSRKAHGYRANKSWKFISVALYEMDGFAHLEGEITHKPFMGNIQHLHHSVESYLFESAFMDQSVHSTAAPLAQYLSMSILREFEPQEGYESNRDKFKMRELWEVVNANPQDHWTVPRMSEQMNVSVRQFQRMMKEHFQLTAEQMLARIRMEKAKELLIASDLTMARIAERIGYESVYSFSKAFKRYFEMTPRALSKQMAKKEEARLP